MGRIQKEQQQTGSAPVFQTRQQPEEAQNVTQSAVQSAAQNIEQNAAQKVIRTRVSTESRIHMVILHLLSVRF